MAAMAEPVEIELGGETVALRCSRRALKALCDRYGGLTVVLQALSQAGEDVQVEVIAAGTNASAEQRKQLPAAIYEAGVFDLIPKLSRFVMLLGTGGREPKADDAEADDKPEGSA